MTRSEAVTAIMDRLGNRTSLESKIITELKLSQTKLEHAQDLPWFLLVRKTDYATVAGTQTVAVVSDFLREFEDVPLYVTDSDGDDQSLDKDDFDVLHRSGNFETNGLPTNYDLIGTNFYLFPTPDKVYTLKSFYYKADAVLSSDIENNWLKYAPELLISDAGIQVAKFLRDPAAVQLFKDSRAEAYTLFLTENEARKQAARAVYMGG